MKIDRKRTKLRPHTIQRTKENVLYFCKGQTPNGRVKSLNGVIAYATSSFHDIIAVNRARCVVVSKCRSSSVIRIDHGRNVPFYVHILLKSRNFNIYPNVSCYRPKYSYLEN